MRVPEFELERWQSIWEHHTELNVAESGVEPMTVGELLEEAGGPERLAGLRLGYPQTNGSEELRGHVAALHPGAGPENAIVTSGCAEANYLATWALVEPGDEVVFMQPNYMQIAGVAHGIGAELRPLWLRPELGWAPDPDELRRLIGPRTRLVAVCNPNNPTGAILDEAAIDAIVAAASAAGVWLLADEVYRGAELDGPRGATFWGRYERVICTGGLSKAYGLPGLRVGWAVAPAELARRLWAHKDYTTIAPTVPGDHLATLALEPATRERIRARTQRILQANYPLVGEWAASLGERLTHRAPAGGAVAWVGLHDGIESGELVRRLRERHGVLAVPGEQFEVPSHLRIGFGGDRDELGRALERIERAIVGRS